MPTTDTERVRTVLHQTNLLICLFRDDDDKVVFKGWARMALLIEQFSIIEVRTPNVGENKPAGVEADVIIDTKGRALLMKVLFLLFLLHLCDTA